MTNQHTYQHGAAPASATSVGCKMNNADNAIAERPGMTDAAVIVLVYCIP